jgi:protein-glutamine gamma-glutamyltransferase
MARIVEANPMLNNSALTLANVSWLIAAMSFVIAPHVTRLPWWMTAACIAAGAWRWGIARYGLRMPPWWAMGLIAFAITAGAFLEYRRLFGREVGVALLIVMLCLKVLEMKMKRDAMVVIFLGFFLALTNFLYSQTIAMGGYMFVCVWLFVATLIGFNRINSEPTISERLVPSAWLMLQAIPMMLVLFFLFPRLTGPLWSMPQENAARTGLSESMAPGDISKLSQSDALAFRVEFEGAVPQSTDLYWRGPVLGAQVGRGWQMLEAPPVEKLEYSTVGNPQRYRVTLQPHNKNWLFALDLPSTLPPNAFLLADYQMRSQQPVNAIKAYEVSSHLQYRVGTDATERDLARYLAYNTRINPRTIAYAREMRAKYPDTKELIDALMGVYNREFTYTFEPPKLGTDPVDEFFFGTKLGFCEHYAGSFALIMRAAGVPARVVTGYQGGEVNPITRQLIVRQAEAHAWTEVWLDDLGWLRVDPTFAVSPLRINRGISAALGPVGVFDTIADADKLGLLKQAVFLWDAVNTEWNRWVVGFNQDRQQSLFEGFGLPKVDWQTLAIWLIAGVFIVGGVVGAFVLAAGYRNRKSPTVEAFEAFCAQVARQGLTRLPHEGPLAFLSRIQVERPALHTEAKKVVDAYIATRYAPPDTGSLRTLQLAVRSFRRST